MSHSGSNGDTKPLKRKAHSSKVRTLGRPRDTRLTDSILTNVLDLIAERGVHGFRTQDVAERAGTSKQALYRRWSTKSQLVAAAVGNALATANPQPPDTGTLRGDLTELLSNTIRTLANTPMGDVIRTLVADAQNEELITCLGGVERERRSLMVHVLKRAQVRGEIAADRDADMDVDALLGIIYFRYLIRRIPITPALAGDCVDAWFTGIRDPERT